MRINLKESAKFVEKQAQNLLIDKRLPTHFTDHCLLKIVYQVTSVDDYYLLELETKADISINCLRCAQHAIIPYENKITLAVADNEKRAETLMEEYETIWSASYFVDLKEIITDELHLYGPLHHKDQENCLLAEKG